MTTRAHQQDVTGIVDVCITHSDGSDDAWIVFVDTTFEPDGADGGVGLRIILNDADVFTGVPYRSRED